jgi:hypothetical protein
MIFRERPGLKIAGTKTMNGITTPIYVYKDMFDSTGKIILPDFENMGDPKDFIKKMDACKDPSYNILDKEIEPVVNKLNKIGCKTSASCSGIRQDHLNKDFYSPKPYITFDSIGKENIRKIDVAIDGTQWRRPKEDGWDMWSIIDANARSGEMLPSGSIELPFRVSDRKKLEQIKKLDKALDDWNYL